MTTLGDANEASAHLADEIAAENVVNSVIFYVAFENGGQPAWTFPAPTSMILPPAHNIATSLPTESDDPWHGKFHAAHLTHFTSAPPRTASLTDLPVISNTTRDVSSPSSGLCPHIFESHEAQ